ncbi:MAG TPA: hypothetical protein VKZ90_07370 [Aequorivita sp.]|nr:hypothetical protein [Aequorivita sp.]
MRRLYLIALIINTMTISAQTKIQSLNYKGSFSFCLLLECDVSLPILKSSDPANICKAVNDSILSMYRDAFAVYIPSYEDYECSFDSPGPDYREIKYSVGLNTKDFLSIVIMDHISPGNGGHGSYTRPDCFNLDLRNNKLLTIDSVFQTNKKKELIKFVKAEIDSIYGQNTFDEMYPNYIYFEGFTLIPNNMIIYYNVYHGSSVHNLIPIKIPLVEVKKYINEKYEWICSIGKEE